MRAGMMSLAVVLSFTTAGHAGEAKAVYPPLPEAFSSFGAAVCDGYVYVYGGHVGKTHQYSTEAVTGKFRRLNLTARAKGWEELPAEVGIQGLALVAHGGKLYRIGGMRPRNKPGEQADNISLAACAVFDPKARKWESLPSMPAGRSSHDAAVVGDLLVVVGGWRMNGQGTKSDWHDTSLILDLSKKPLKWESLPQPFERRALNVAVREGRVYAIGGMASDGTTEKTVDVLDLKTRSWTRGPALPGPIRNGFTPAACALGGKLFVSPPDGTVYRLTERKDAWEEVGALDKPRMVHRIVPAREDLLLVLGGASRAGNVAATEAIEPACCGKPLMPPAADPTRQVFCPVMTSMPVDADAKEVEYQGVKIKLCCSSCARKWHAEPEAYLNSSILPQLKEMNLPKRKIEQVFCPVNPDRVVSSKDPSAQHEGVTVYFFSEQAKKRFLANPRAYASKIAPQAKTDKTSAAPIWPGFRGLGDGVTAGDLPLKWSATHNIGWKISLPGYGQSSPVVWKQRVYLTAVDGTQREKGFVLSFDAQNGKELWRYRFEPTQKAKWSNMVSRAAPTPVVDASALYVFFEGGDLLALSHAGKLLWSRSLVKDFGEFQNGHGLGSSLAQTDDAVIALIDHRGPSYLLAVSKQTGKTLWKTERASRSSWTSPVVTSWKGRTVVVVSSTGSVAGYDARDGALLWERDDLAGNTIASANVAGDLIVVGAGLGRMGLDPKKAARSNCCLKMVQKDGRPSVEMCWTAEKVTSSFASPLIHRGHAYFVSEQGVVYCLDIATGAQRFAERIDGPCWASPLGAGEHVYFFGKNGVTTVLRTGRTFQVEAVNRLWDEAAGPPQKDDEKAAGATGYESLDPVVYGIAVVDRTIFLRTGTMLYCVR
jgi:outer membrane protein assembly factor BamB